MRLIATWVLLLIAKSVMADYITTTVDDIGLQTLSFKGTSYLNGSILTSDSFRGNALWQAVGGEQTTIPRPNISAATLRTHDTTWVEQTYGTAPRTLRARCTYEHYDFRTLKVTVEVTNTSASETLLQIDVYPFGYGTRKFQLPGSSSATRPSGQTLHLGSVGGGTGQEVEFWPAYLFQGTWGYCAVWSPDLANNSCLVIPWTDSADQTLFRFQARNYSFHRNGDSSFFSYYNDEIAPGATWTYHFFARFGLSSTAKLGAIAPIATDGARAAFPFINNWTNRNPVSRGFLCASSQTSLTNPRGYFYDSTIDVSNSANFLSLTTAWANQTVARMNPMDPKPQGIIFWDLDGNPNDASVYRGAPHLIATLSPEMDLAADTLFSIFHVAGYYTGMTLRADTLELIGGVWTHIAPTKDQIVPYLATRVDYVRNRWGDQVRLFYIDSISWDLDSDGTRDIIARFRDLRTLQAMYPTCLFLPEQENNYYYSCCAPYMQATATTSTPEWARDIYRHGFAVISPFGITPLPTDELIAAVKAGDALFIDGYRTTSINDDVLAIYQEAML